MKLINNRQKYIYGYGGGPPSPPAPHYPVLDPEGATGVLQPTGISVSLTQVQVLDVLSEGPIEGLVTGEYTFQGTLGNIGYDSVIFSGYDVAPTTTSRYLRSVYWDNVPVVDAENNFNFEQIQTTFTAGNPLGSTLSQINPSIADELTISRAIGERLRGGGDIGAKVYRVLNTDCKEVRINIKVTSLNQTVVDPATFGDVKEAQVDYTINYKPLFATVGKTPKTYSLGKAESIKANINYGYIRQSKVSLIYNGNYVTDSDFIGWEIQIVRSTPDSTDVNTRNQTYIDSLTEVYGDTFTYPNVALACSKFSAEYFSQIPSRIFDARLLKVNIPSNYDPILRKYNGLWDGTFKDDKTWTDNPAWCFYDLITNSRYGLGQYISEDLVDKWSLYEIAQYCDVLVPDGLGGIEPRFVCNIIINGRDDAYKVINQMASIFRAMVYYSAGSIYAVQDSPKEPIFQFTNANVENGDFSYSSSSRRVRHTVAIVRYNDETNYYQPSIEYIEDFDGIKRYGIREIEIAAIGATSRGQAIRQGRWALFSEADETETISFTAGLEGSYLRPGDIFQTFDSNRRSNRLGGRTYNIINTGTNCLLTLDSLITGISNTGVYDFSILTPTFNYDSSLVTLDDSTEIDSIRRNQLQKMSFSGNQTSIITGSDNIARTNILFSGLFNSTNYNISGKLVWTLNLSGSDSADISTFGANSLEEWRTIRVEEKEENRFKISALQYSNNKYNLIESGLSFAASSTTQIPPSPNAINLTQVNLTPNGNTKGIDYNILSNNISGVNTFLVYLKTSPFVSQDFVSGNSSKYLINAVAASSPSGVFIPSVDGHYYFRTYASNGAGIVSNSYAQNDITISNINPIRDIIISSLAIGSGQNPNTNSKFTEQYTVSSPTFNWQVGFAQNASIPSNFTYRLTARKPSINNTPSSDIYFTMTGYNPANQGAPSYVFNIQNNISAISSNGEHGPFREYDFIVEAMNNSGNSSAGGNFLTNSNQDSSYNNPSGYDIIYVNNPKVTGIYLSSGNLVPNNGYITDAWIDTDGNVKISLISGLLPTDIAGGIVYSCPAPFSDNEALGIIPTTKTITATSFTADSTNLIAPTRLFDSDKSYIALSLYDVFDAAELSNGVNITGTLPITNTVLVSKRGAFAYQPNIYRLWIDVQALEPFSQDITYTSVGVTRAYVDTSNVFNVIFDNAFPSTNYTILSLATSDESPILGKTYIPRNVYNFQKSVTGFKMPVDNIYGNLFYGKRFFAVLYDGKS